MRFPNLADVFGNTVNVHTIRIITLYTKCLLHIWNSINFPLQKCEAIPCSSWQTSTLKDCEASYHQVKSECDSTTKLPSYFSFKIPSFPQFSMAVARCYNSWNLNTSSLRNAWWTCLPWYIPWFNPFWNVKHTTSSATAISTAPVYCYSTILHLLHCYILLIAHYFICYTAIYC